MHVNTRYINSTAKVFAKYEDVQVVRPAPEKYLCTLVCLTQKCVGWGSWAEDQEIIPHTVRRQFVCVEYCLKREYRPVCDDVIRYILRQLFERC